MDRSASFNLQYAETQTKTARRDAYGFRDDEYFFLKIMMHPEDNKQYKYRK
jgi:hypothetical protein